MNLYLRLISITLRSQMQYRLSFLADVLVTGGQVIIEFVSFAAAFTRFGSIGGWALGEVAFLYGLVEMAFATMDMVFSGFDPSFFSQQIRRGTFDQFLLRPASLTLQVFGSEFIARRLGRVGQGALVFALALYLHPVQWTPGKLLYFPLVYLSTFAFFGGLFVVGATFCFWTVESLEAMNIFTYGGSAMLSYPMHIYPEWLQRFFTFIIPGALLVYYPALYFLDKPYPAPLPFLAPLAGFGFLGLALAFWQFGIRKYTSTGT